MRHNLDACYRNSASVSRMNLSESRTIRLGKGIFAFRDQRLDIESTYNNTVRMTRMVFCPDKLL